MATILRQWATPANAKPEVVVTTEEHDKSTDDLWVEPDRRKDWHESNSEVVEPTVKFPSWWLYVIGSFVAAAFLLGFLFKLLVR